MKKFLCILIATLVLSAFCTNASTPVCDGIDLIKTTKSTEDGLQNISVLKIDLNNPFIKLKTLYSSKGINRLDRVKNIVDDHGAIAGINGDFFLWSNGGGSSVGYNVIDGELITSPSVDENMASVATDYNGNFIFDYFTENISVTTENGRFYKIKNINKYDDLSGLVLYNPKWGEVSLGSTGTLVEVVVENDIIKEIRRDMPAAEIPENGYVLAGLSDLTDFFENITEGETLHFDIKITPDINIENAVGGGTLLVAEGKKAPITHTSPGRAPRSAFGIDKAADFAYFVTVDGRGANDSIGMTLNELTNYLLELGVHNAINFDGGGSSQLVAKVQGDNSSSYLNTPSENRSVSNAYGVFHSGIENILIDPDEKMYLFEDMPVTLQLYPEDTLGDMKISNEQFKFGTASTKLWYDFTVESDRLQSAGFDFDTPIIINDPSDEISVDVYANSGNKQWLRCFVTDAKGNLTRCTLADSVDWDGWKTLDLKLDDSLEYPVKLTRMYIVQPELNLRTKGAVYFDNITVNKRYDYHKNNLSVLSPMQYDNTLLNRISAIAAANELKKSDYSLNMSGAYADITGNIARENCRKTITENINILQLTDSQIGSISWLESEIQNNTSDCIVIVSNDDIYDRIYHLLKTAKKPVYYVYEGTQTYFETNSNVTKISLFGKTPNLSGNNCIDMLNIYKTGKSFDFNIRRFKLY